MGCFKIFNHLFCRFQSANAVCFPPDAFSSALASVYKKQCVNCDGIKQKITSIETDYERKLRNLTALKNPDTKETMHRAITEKFQRELQTMRDVQAHICRGF